MIDIKALCEEVQRLRPQVSTWFVLDSESLLQHPGPAARLEGHVRAVVGGLKTADAAAAEAVLGTVQQKPLDALKMDEEYLGRQFGWIWTKRAQLCAGGPLIGLLHVLFKSQYILMQNYV